MKKFLFILFLNPFLSAFQTNVPYAPPYDISQTLDLVFKDSLKEEHLSSSFSEEVMNTFLEIKEQVMVDPKVLFRMKLLYRVYTKDIDYFLIIMSHLFYIQDYIEKSSDSKTPVFKEVFKVTKLCESKIDSIIRELNEDLYVKKLISTKLD